MGTVILNLSRMLLICILFIMLFVAFTTITELISAYMDVRFRKRMIRKEMKRINKSLCKRNNEIVDMLVNKSTTKEDIDKLAADIFEIDVSDLKKD